MKKLKKLKGSNIFFVLVLVALLCAAVTSCSDSDSADEQASFDGISVSAGGENIRIISRDGKNLLFLPSFPCTWELDGGFISVDGKTVRSGDEVSLEGICEITVAASNGDFPVTVAVSDNVSTLFMSITDGSMEEVNASPDHSASASGTLRAFSEDGKVRYSGELAKIRGRGNATWGKAEKRPYQIELAEKSDLLGLAAAKKFVLLADYYDPSALRNAAALTLADSVSEGWSPDFVYTDVYADGEYMGVYLLCDKVDISEEKIAIFDLEKKTEAGLPKKPEDYPRGGTLSGTAPGSAKWYELPSVPDELTGGYLLEVDYTDRYPAEACGFVTDRGLPVVIKSPEYASKEQVEYIRSYFCAFEDALFSEDGRNTEGKHYSEYVLTDTLTFRYLFEEFVLNIDAGVTSFYISKDAGGKLDFSCVWDYDCAFGNYNKFADLTSPYTLFTGETETRNDGLMPNLFYAALTHAEFRKDVSELWQNTFGAESARLSEKISGLADTLSPSLACDDLLYPRASRHDRYLADSGDTPAEALDKLLDFIDKRISFFDGVFTEQFSEK